MAQADVPMAKIVQLLGDIKTATTKLHYARFSPADMSDASDAARS